MPILDLSPLQIYCSSNQIAERENAIITSGRMRHPFFTLHEFTARHKMEAGTIQKAVIAEASDLGYPIT